MLRSVIRPGERRLAHGISRCTARGPFTAALAPARPGHCKDGKRSRRLLSPAAVPDGMSRTDAARVGGMDRQTPRVRVHRFNDHGRDGLKNIHAGGREARLSPDRKERLAQIIGTGPDPAAGGAVRRRRVDMKRVIKERFGVAFHEPYAGLSMKASGSSRLSARPRHPKQDEGVMEMSKKPRRHARRTAGRCAGTQGHRDPVPGRSPDRSEERADRGPGRERHTATPARRPTP